MKKLSQTIVKLLKRKKLKISFAESCTGGLLSSSITSISGSSKVFTLGLVTYSNKAKINVLKVPKNIIIKHGAVSYETCLYMVKNLYKISKTNISVSITGIAGPKGGTKQKPVGLVFIGVKKDNKIYAGFRPEDIFRQFNIIPSTVVGFYIKLTSLRKVGLLNISYKIQSDYDWLYRIIVINKMKGIRTKGDEVFGDLGKSKFSSNFSFFSGLINELKIRFNNKQNLGIIIFIFFGRITMKLFQSIKNW